MTLDRETNRLTDQQVFRRVLRRATGTLLAALGVPMLGLLALVFFLYRSAVWVDHSDQVISAANRVEKLLVSMQAGFRGYRLSNNEVYLAPFTEARPAFSTGVGELEALIADNPSQIQALGGLRANSATWLAFVDKELADIRAGRTRFNDPAFLAIGAPLFKKNLDDLDAFIEREETLRFSRESTLQRMVAAVLTVFGLSALAGIPLLAIWLQRLLRQVGNSYQAAVSEAVHRANELSVTLSSIGDAVVATDAQGNVDFLNPVAEGLMGWGTSEARGRPLAEVFTIFNEYTGEITANPVERVLKEKIIVGLANHTVLRSRDGSERAIEDSAAPIRGTDGEVLGVILVFHDVTGKRDKERLLEESEERLRLLNEVGEATRALAGPELIMAATTRLLGQHLHASRCAYAEVEEDSEHFTILQDYTDNSTSTVGKYELSLFGPRATADMRAGRNLVIRDVEAELTPENGATMFLAIGVRAIICYPLLKEGKLRAMMAVHHAQPRRWTAAEIKLVGEVVERCWATIERARAEAFAEIATRKIAETAERFRLLAEVVSLQVWTANVRGELDFANFECSNYLGVDPEHGILGHAWAQFVHLDDLPTALRGWQVSLATGNRYEVEFRLRGKTQGFRWFLVRAQAMRGPDGQIIQWFGTNTDIDELKRAQAAAEQASRTKDDFIATLSHELRTPLTPVLMTAAALRDDDRLPHEIREQLGMIERNIALEARLIDDLLDVTSITRGKLSLRPMPSDTHSLIGLAAEIVRDEALTKEISIERNLSAKQSGLKVDPARFQQVIWNLLRNAVKFTPRGGRITIQTRDWAGPDGQPWLLVEIADSGIGIDEPNLERIFLPFEQGGRAGDHRYGGIGLGLAIARAIVDLHGGRISARSAGANQGSTFLIELPGAMEPPHGVSGRAPDTRLPFLGVLPSAPTAAKGLAPARGSLRLLLVEDHPATLQVLSRLLAAAGHRVAPAQTITDALVLAAKEPFDLVISDLGLPDGTGTELMEQLRSRHGMTGIALSGYGMEEDIARSREAGFAAHLIKPVDFAQLRRVLEEVRPRP